MPAERVGLSAPVPLPLLPLGAAVMVGGVGLFIASSSRTLDAVVGTEEEEEEDGASAPEVLVASNASEGEDADDADAASCVLDLFGEIEDTTGPVCPPVGIVLLQQLLLLLGSPGASDVAIGEEGVGKALAECVGDVDWDVGSDDADADNGL